MRVTSDKGSGADMGLGGGEGWRGAGGGWSWREREGEILGGSRGTGRDKGFGGTRRHLRKSSLQLGHVAGRSRSSTNTSVLHDAQHLGCRAPMTS